MTQKGQNANYRIFDVRFSGGGGYLSGDWSGEGGGVVSSCRLGVPDCVHRTGGYILAGIVSNCDFRMRIEERQ